MRKVHSEMSGLQSPGEEVQNNDLTQHRPVSDRVNTVFGIVFPALLVAGFVWFVATLDDESAGEDLRYARYVAFHVSSVLLLLISCAPKLYTSCKHVREKRVECGLEPLGASFNLTSKMLMGLAYGVAVFESRQVMGDVQWIVDVGNVSGNCSVTDTNNLLFAYAMLLAHTSALAASALLLVAAIRRSVQFKRFLYASTVVTGVTASTFTAIKAIEMGNAQPEGCYSLEKSIGYTFLASQIVILLANLASLVKNNSRRCIRDRKHEVVPLQVAEADHTGSLTVTRNSSPVRGRVWSLAAVKVVPLGALRHLDVPQDEGVEIEGASVASSPK